MTKPVYHNLTVVVNGLPTIVRMRKTECLHYLRKRALIYTNNVGQPAENWEIRDAMGTLLNLEATPEELLLPSNATLFLNLHAGVGGACQPH